MGATMFGLCCRLNLAVLNCVVPGFLPWLFPQMCHKTGRLVQPTFGLGWFEFSGVELRCFTLSRLTISTDVSLIKPEVSSNSQFKGFLYSVSWPVRKLVNSLDWPDRSFLNPLLHNTDIIRRCVMQCPVVAKFTCFIWQKLAHWAWPPKTVWIKLVAIFVLRACVVSFVPRSRGGWLNAEKN